MKPTLLPAARYDTCRRARAFHTDDDGRQEARQADPASTTMRAISVSHESPNARLSAMKATVKPIPQSWATTTRSERRIPREGLRPNLEQMPSTTKHPGIPDDKSSHNPQDDPVGQPSRTEAVKGYRPHGQEGRKEAPKGQERREHSAETTRPCFRLTIDWPLGNQKSQNHTGQNGMNASANKSVPAPKSDQDGQGPGYESHQDQEKQKARQRRTTTRIRCHERCEYPKAMSKTPMIPSKTARVRRKTLHGRGDNPAIQDPYP